MKGKILYLLIWAATAYIGVLYYSPSLLGLSVLEFLLPLCSFLMLQYMGRKIKGKVYLPIGVAEKNQMVQVGIEVENTTRIPVSHMYISMTVENTFYRQKETIGFQGMTGGKRTTRLLTGISSRQCGPLRVEIEQVRICDLFHLFQKKIQVEGMELLAVMPEVYQASLALTESTKEFPVESDEYDKNRPGDDPSEVFQIREYRGGDRMQSIHWKLSARTDSLMVREYSFPIACAVVVFLDMEYQPRENYGYLDEFIEAAVGISLGLLEAGSDHYIVWYDKNIQDLQRLEVKEKDDVFLLIERIFSAGPYTDSVAMEEIYREKYRGETWRTQILWNLRRELWKDGKLEMDLAGTAREVLENEELFI